MSWGEKNLDSKFHVDFTQAKALIPLETIKRDQFYFHFAKLCGPQNK